VLLTLPLGNDATYDGTATHRVWNQLKRDVHASAAIPQIRRHIQYLTGSDGCRGQPPAAVLRLVFTLNVAGERRDSFASDPEAPPHPGRNADNRCRLRERAPDGGAAGDGSGDGGERKPECNKE
jgi:hypothetical protein